MYEHLLIGLASIVILGVLAQWIAWRTHLPAILLLLVFGILAGPVGGILKPDLLFGDLLFPLVSLSVAIILFEGGLSLKIDELRKIGHVVRNLTTIAIFITWLLAAFGAHYLAGLDLEQSILLGAILVVSGPTVVIPLLRQIRPIGKVGSIVKWEGIVNDPIGAILAVLVFEVIALGGLQQGTSAAIIGAVKAAVFGGLIGLIAAAIVVLMLRRYLVPDFLQNPITLVLVVVSYAISDMIQPESGLLTVTVMGVALTNQRYVSIHHILEFKETLRVLLISSLFIILAARITVPQLESFSVANWMFVAFLILIVRPFAVWLSTIRQNVNWREKLFLSWMAPRGIVAAAVSAVFAIRLAEIGFSDSVALVPLTFQVIVGTVAVYGLTAPFLARQLGLAQIKPQGVLIAGAQAWARNIARVLRDQGFVVAMVDSNWSNATEARRSGCQTYYNSVLSENLMADIQLDGIGRLLAMTPNDEVNALAALRFSEIFGRSQIYQLAPLSKKGGKLEQLMPRHLRGRYLFSEKSTYSYFQNRMSENAVVKRTTLTDEYPYTKFRDTYGEDLLLLFVITPDRTLEVCTVDTNVKPKPGDTIIALVNE